MNSPLFSPTKPATNFTMPASDQPCIEVWTTKDAADKLVRAAGPVFANLWGQTAGRVSTDGVVEFSWGRGDRRFWAAGHAVVPFGGRSAAQQRWVVLSSTLEAANEQIVENAIKQIRVALIERDPATANRLARDLGAPGWAA
jgi:hypothetical protein